MIKKLQLNTETNELLKYYKEKYCNLFGYNISYSSIVNKIIEELNTEIHKIDWELVKNTKSNKSPKNFKDNKPYVTTLDFSDTTQKIINNIQKEIRTQFGIARVFMAYAVKNSLKAYYLKNEQKINIYKK